MTHEEAFTRLLVAMFLGAAIGFERQWRNHHAGLRTNTLITIGSAGLMIFSQMLPGMDASGAGRIASQIITGVGFLCAGVIMHEGVNVRGLNTAATLWCSVAVGMFAGAGIYWGAGMLSMLIILTNLILRPIVSYINGRSPISDEIEACYTLFLTCGGGDEPHIRAAMQRRLDDRAGHLRQLQTSREAGQTRIAAELKFLQREDSKMEKLTTDLGRLDGVISIGWQLH